MNFAFLSSLLLYLAFYSVFYCVVEFGNVSSSVKSTTNFEIKNGEEWQMVVLFDGEFRTDLCFELMGRISPKTVFQVDGENIA